MSRARSLGVSLAVILTATAHAGHASPPIAMTDALHAAESSGDLERQIEALRALGEAMAAEGDAPGALALYHRERDLHEARVRVMHDAVLKDLQVRNEAEARQRDIELLARDNALKSETLANRAMQHDIRRLVEIVMLLAILLVAGLYRRVRKTNRQLATNQAQLRAQSERDPLTNLANRRHFNAVMARVSQDGRFEGAFILVDIDHFKRVNDVHGHGVGDQVLVEVARRLTEVVRADDDLVVRWGGEELLVLARSKAARHAEQLALRVLRAIGDTPFRLGAVQLRVTASVGFAHFPLPPPAGPVPWERAINLVDLALYTAKKEGRNAAVGITAAEAATPAELEAIEADFARARREGAITLHRTA